MGACKGKSVCATRVCKRSMRVCTDGVCKGEHVHARGVWVREGVCVQQECVCKGEALECARRGE